jgi:DNA-binding SARP family transcriptional activator
LLGGFEVFVGSRAVEGNAWRLRKAGSLVKLLALARGHRLHQEWIMDVLWPDLDAKSQANNLHRTLHFAREVLEATRANAASPPLRLRGDLLELYPDSPLWVDVEAFESAAVAARRSREPAAYRAAVDLYAGDLLPGDRYEVWAEERREGLRLTYLSLLLETAGLHEERCEYGAGIEALRRAVAEEPSHEEAHAGLMRLLALRGGWAEAILQYERLRKVLSREFDAEPGPAIRRVYEEVQAGRCRPGGCRRLVRPPPAANRRNPSAPRPTTSPPP